MRAAEVVRTRACMHLRGWGVVSESAGVTVAGEEGVLGVEGVPGAAVCSLLRLDVLFSFLSSRAADVARIWVGSCVDVEAWPPVFVRAAV